MKHVLPALLIVLTLAACEGYRRPSLDSAGDMSSDTLCYRYAYGKRTEAMKTEIDARNLDCGELLASQPGTGAVGESRW